METTRIDGDRSLNRDPITGTPGAHPVGTGVGAVAGGLATGAAVGAVAGPVGAAVGALAGAVIGGLAGKGVAEMIDPTTEESYWRDNYATRSYVEGGATFDDYGPAYRYGVDSYGRTNGGSFYDAEPQLMRDWESARGSSRLTWDNAKHATRDAWERVSDTVERITPGDSDRDGK